MSEHVTDRDHGPGAVSTATKAARGASPDPGSTPGRSTVCKFVRDLGFDPNLVLELVLTPTAAEVTQLRLDERDRPYIDPQTEAPAVETIVVPLAGRTFPWGTIRGGVDG